MVATTHGGKQQEAREHVVEVPASSKSSEVGIGMVMQNASMLSSGEPSCVSFKTAQLTECEK